MDITKEELINTGWKKYLSRTRGTVWSHPRLSPDAVYFHIAQKIHQEANPDSYGVGK